MNADIMTRQEISFKAFNYFYLNNDFIKFIQSINKKLIDINKEEHNTVDDFINEVITRLLKSGKMITDLTDKEKYLFVLGIVSATIFSEIISNE